MKDFSAAPARGARASAKKNKNMRTKALLTSVIIVGTLGLTACSTFNSRAKEKAAVYNALPTQTQQRLEKGKISIGDTQDMAFIALGNPDAKREITTANDAATVWIYRTYWEDYTDAGWIGWHRYYEPFGDAYSIYHEQVPLALSRERVAEVIRITFKNGKVIAVDHATLN